MRRCLCYKEPDHFVILCIQIVLIFYLERLIFTLTVSLLCFHSYCFTSTHLHTQSSPHVNIHTVAVYETSVEDHNDRVDVTRNGNIVHYLTFYEKNWEYLYSDKKNSVGKPICLVWRGALGLTLDPLCIHGRWKKGGAMPNLPLHCIATLRFTSSLTLILSTYLRGLTYMMLYV